MPPSIEVSEKEIEQASTFIESLKETDINTVVDERKTKIEEVATSGEVVAPQIKEKDDGMSFFN
jgi:ribosomal protein L12E/L44/L45/RPP1/RPP2